jgi:hypothetical protein
MEPPVSEVYVIWFRPFKVLFSAFSEALLDAML